MPVKVNYIGAIFAETTGQACLLRYQSGSSAGYNMCNLIGLMTIIDFLKLVEQHTFIVHYYAFSMILSTLLGRFFLLKMGQPKIWNYFFSLLIYVMSVFGIFSVIVFFYQLWTFNLSISLIEILIPFITMVLAIFMIRNHVNISLLTGFGSYKTFFVFLFFILTAGFLIDYFQWWPISSWPIYAFFLFLVVMTFVVHQVLFKRKIFRNVKGM